MERDRSFEREIRAVMKHGYHQDRANRLLKRLRRRRLQLDRQVYQEMRLLGQAALKLVGAVPLDAEV